MENFIKVGIIGYGLSSRYFFAPYFSVHPHFILNAIVTSQTEEVSKDYPDAVAFSDVDGLLANPEIDLVVVASPNYTHYEYAKKALLAGKNVIVEKPFTVTSIEAEELIQLSLRQGKLLIPFQNRRWDGDFLTVQKLIEDNVLGEILEFESHFDRFRPSYDRVAWKNEPLPGNGILYDIGPHLIDQALCFFGKPDFVFGDIRTHRLTGVVDDYFEIQLYYPVVKVILKASVMVRELGPRFIVTGRKGSFVKYGLDQQESNLRSGIIPGDPQLVKDIDENYGLLHAEIDQQVVRKRVETIHGNYMAYFDNVYLALQKKVELIVKPTDAKMTIEVIERAIQSHEQKRLLPF
jgi:scyllo-inositol 2-dehydrogenase (NADP+)